MDIRNSLRIKLFHTIEGLRYSRFTLCYRVLTKLINLFPLPKVEDSCIIKIPSGISLQINPVEDKGIERTLFRKGHYEQGTLEILKNLITEEYTFIDVGANIGLMSLYVAKLPQKGNVISIEAHPKTYEILQTNLELNDASNIYAYNLAMGANEGVAKIYDRMQVNRGSASLIEEKSGTCYSVKIQQLDTFLFDNKLCPKVSCLKIDVEGWELEVLKGSRKLLSANCAPACIIECSEDHQLQGGEVQDIYKYLKEVNAYRIFRLSMGKDHPSPLTEIKSPEELPKHDNLVCLLPKHIARFDMQEIL